MSTCGFSKRMLHEWYDGAAGSNASRVEAHVQRCERCAAEVETLQRTADQLRGMVDAGVGHVEPLVALRSIHQRIRDADRRSLLGRWRVLCGDLWLLHRRLMVAAVAAVALGALSAPVVAWWLAKAGVDVAGTAQTAAVVVESLEYGDDASRAVVYNAEDGMTTLIWVEPTPATETDGKARTAEEGL